MPPATFLRPDAAVDRLLELYRTHLLSKEVTSTPHRTEVLGAGVRLTFPDQAGGQVIEGNLASWRTLAGRFWGAALRRQLDFQEDAWIPVLFERGHDGSAAWPLASDLQRDLRLVLGSFADWLWSSKLHDEALMVAGEIWTDGPRSKDSVWVALPAALRKAADGATKASGAIEEILEKRGSASALAMLKAIHKVAADPSPRQRAAVAVEFIDTVLEAEPDNPLPLHELFASHLLPLVGDPHPAVRERALAACERWTADLMSARAYAEALPLLSTLIDAAVALDWTLPLRYEARLALGDVAGAEADWERFARLARLLAGSFRVSTSIFWKGAPGDVKTAASVRAADALLAWSLGRDPCEHRRVTKAWKATLGEPAALRGRARVLAEGAVAAWQEAADRITSKNSGVSEPSEQGFRHQAFGVLGAIDEAEGRPGEALANYEKARDIVRAGGLSWQRDFYGDEIRRLEEAKGSASPGPSDAGSDGGFPESFDPAWLMDPATATQAATRALERWRAVPSPRLPRDVRSAVGTPAARLILANLRAWHLPERIEYERRCARVTAIVQRFASIVDAHCDSRELERWEDALGDSIIRLAVGAGDDEEPARRVETWLRRLEEAEGDDEEALLATLPGEGLAGISAALSSLGPWYDPHFAFVDRLLAAGAGVDETRSALRAFEPALAASWSAFASPALPSAKLDRASQQLAAVAGSNLPLVIRDFLLELRAHPSSQLLPTEALWPFAHVWHPDLDAFAASYVTGELDGKRPSPAGRERRIKMARWLLSHVSAPLLGAAVDKLEAKQRRRAPKEARS